MSRSVYDASAVLAVLLGEPGADAALHHLCDGEVSAVSHSEALAKIVDKGVPLEDAVRQMRRLEYAIVPFDAEQATLAASLRVATKPLGLSFGDRACLALGLHHNLPILTADRVWSSLSLGVEIQPVR